MAYVPVLTAVDRSERQRRVAARYAQGVHAAVVAAEFGIDRHYVCQIARAYGVSRRPGRPCAA